MELKDTLAKINEMPLWSAKVLYVVKELLICLNRN